MNIFLNLLSAALYVMLFQNLIFNGGYGLSEAVRMSAKPRQLLPMAVFITLFSTVTSALCVLIDFFPIIHNLNEIYHALIYVGILLVVYIFAMIIANIIPKVQPATKRRIGIAAFNTLVLAMPLINYRSAFNVVESIGAGLGAGTSVGQYTQNKAVGKDLRGAERIGDVLNIPSMAPQVSEAYEAYTRYAKAQSLRCDQAFCQAFCFRILFRCCGSKCFPYFYCIKKMEIK